jgi:hypothetical protein
MKQEINKNKPQHAACTIRAGFQRFWLSALAKFVTGDPSGAGQVENASPKTPHGAYSFPLGYIFRRAIGSICQIKIKYLTLALVT